LSYRFLHLWRVGLGRRSKLHEGTSIADPANAVVDGCLAEAS
jgi:hypothetical protein